MINISSLNTILNVIYEKIRNNTLDKYKDIIYFFMKKDQIIFLERRDICQNLVIIKIYKVP